MASEVNLNRTTLKGSIRNALANYVEWTTGKGFHSIDDAADKIVESLPGDIPKKVSKVITNAIHLGVKLNYPIEKLGKFIANKIREGGKVNERVDHKNKVKEGEDVMTHNKKKESNSKRKKFNHNGANDLSWVSNYPELLNGVIGPNFFRKKGLPENPITSGSFPTTIGGVASIELLLTNGNTQGQGYNLAIDKLYASLRSANTGGTVYTRLDLQRYMWNARMILALIRYGRRAYGVLRKFALTDKSVPQAYFKAMGLDYDTFAAGAANLRQELNYLSTRLHTTMPYKDDTMERTAWLFDYIFADSNDAKSQKYLFSLNSRMQYWDDNAAPGMWKALTNITNYANTTNNTGTNLTQFLSNIRTLVESATRSVTASLIAADMLKCFGIETTSYYTLIDENYETPVTYNEEVLTEIQNATLIGEVTHSSTAVQSGDVLIDESTGYIKTEIVNPVNTNIINSIFTNINYMNSYKDHLNNAEIVTFARLQATGVVDSTYNNKIDWNCRGTETATLIRYIYIDGGVTYKYNLTYVIGYKFMHEVFSNGGNITNFFRLITLWSQFDWSPMLGWARADYGDPLNPSNEETLGYLWDFNDYALVDNDMLETYHDIAIMSQFNAPLYIRDIRLNAIA